MEIIVLENSYKRFLRYSQPSSMTLFFSVRKAKVKGNHFPIKVAGDLYNYFNIQPQLGIGNLNESTMELSDEEIPNPQVSSLAHHANANQS